MRKQGNTKQDSKRMLQALNANVPVGSLSKGWLVGEGASLSTSRSTNEAQRNLHPALIQIRSSATTPTYLLPSPSQQRNSTSFTTTFPFITHSSVISPQLFPRPAISSSERNGARYPLPLSLLNTAQGHPMLVELKNGETLNGHLVNCDTWMNLTLKEVVQTSPEGDKFFRLAECYVRGNNIKYLRVPDEIIDLVKETQTQQSRDGHGGRGGNDRGRGGYRGDRGNRGGRSRGRGRGGGSGGGGSNQ
ncbi:hypothetical protein HOY82DRAFT_578545 [Tuber indicum]|nr:hypothetical protein HOY82DRAFT_578545 [Tuber indicum]